MKRRHFLRSAAGVSLGVATAGCSQGGDGGDEGPTETAVVNVQDTDAGIDVDTTPTDAPEIELVGLEFNRTGDNRFEVQGGLRNTSGQPFSHVELEIQLYDANEQEDELIDSSSRQGEMEYLAADSTWTFRFSFRSSRIGTVDYYTATATAEIAESTP